MIHQGVGWFQDQAVTDFHLHFGFENAKGMGFIFSFGSAHQPDGTNVRCFIANDLIRLRIFQCLSRAKHVEYLAIAQIATLA